MNKEYIISTFKALTNETIPWWKKQAEFDEAKKILVGLKVRFPAGPNNGGRDIGIIRDMFIQQPAIVDGRKINAKINVAVDFESLDGLRYCHCLGIRDLALASKPKIKSVGLLARKIHEKFGRC